MKKGFTLIELIFVIVVLGIIAGVVIQWGLSLFSGEVPNDNLPTAPTSYSVDR